MNTKGNNPAASAEDYEDMAVRKSQFAKRAAVGAGILGLGATAAYAASSTGNPVETTEEELTEEDIVNGAEVGPDAPQQPAVEEQTTTRYVYVEKPEPPQQEETDESDVTWDKTTNYYLNDEKIGSVEEGTVEGHKFMIADVDGDDKADVIGVDMNDNGRFESDELSALTPEQNVVMGHESAMTVNEKHYSEGMFGEGNEEEYAYVNSNDQPIHNNFEDEKTGESYNGDFAQDNPDYNPDADVDYGNNQYYAENYGYGNEGNQYQAGLNPEDTEEYSDTEGDMTADYDMAENEVSEQDLYDTMMSGEEFLG